MNELSKYEPIDLDELQRTAKLLAVSGYFAAKGDSVTAIAQIATQILAGREMGYGPYASVSGIHIINGKPQISANLMAAKVKNHPVYDYRVRQMDDKAVVIEFFEKGQSLGVSEFTLDDAKRAQVKNMDKFPRNMLFARAMSNGVRWFCPDVFEGNSVYTEGEIDDNPAQSMGRVVSEDPITKRTIDQETGEIVESHLSEQDLQSIDDAPPVSWDSPTNQPIIMAAINLLHNVQVKIPDDAFRLITKCKELHSTSKGTLSTIGQDGKGSGQYGLLAGKIDTICNREGAHNAVLSALCGYHVSSAKPPGNGLKPLIDWLVKNNTTTVQAITDIWSAIQKAERINIASETNGAMETAADMLPA